MPNKLPKNSVIIRVDFSDMRHGLDVLLASTSLEERKHVANMLVADVAKLPPCTALSDFVGALHPTLLFGDAPGSDIERVFGDLAIAYSGYSASVLIAQKHQAMAQAHGKRGGRLKGDTSERDDDIWVEFTRYRRNSTSDRDAVQKLEIARSKDPQKDPLSVEAIRTILKRYKQKNNALKK